MPGAERLRRIEQQAADHVGRDLALSAREPVEKKFQLDPLHPVIREQRFQVADAVRLEDGGQVGMEQAETAEADTGRGFDPGADVERAHR